MKLFNRKFSASISPGIDTLIANGRYQLHGYSPHKLKMSKCMEKVFRSHSLTTKFYNFV